MFKKKDTLDYFQLGHKLAERPLCSRRYPEGICQPLLVCKESENRILWMEEDSEGGINAALVGILAHDARGPNTV